MDFLEELKWRGMLQDTTPGLEEVLSKGMVTGYIGFDPTAPALTIGNYVQIMLLKLFQLSGHKPIVLMGGATGRIGDPSGKDKERELKSFEELDYNLAQQTKYFSKFLDFENAENGAEIVNNKDFYENMTILDFLRTVGKTLTVNYMMSKESVKKRVETGISFTEFSYQLLQAYDFQCLFKEKNCMLQMGGSDQWGNITSGTEFIRRNLSEKAYAVTTPLLTKADGSKFGKSEKGNLWLDPEMTSPYEFYQFWIRANDEDVPKFIRYFTLKSKEEVEAMEKEHADNPQALKEALAEELTIRVHSKEALEAARNVSDLLFRKIDKDRLNTLDKASFEIVRKEISSFEIPADLVHNGVNILDLLTEHTAILGSKGEGRRAIQGNAISINKEKISDHEFMLDSSMFMHNRYLLIENGKKNKYLVFSQE